MGVYKTHWTSVFAFARVQASLIATRLALSAPPVINLDAHAQAVEDLPLGDFIGVGNFGFVANSGKIYGCHASFAASTYNDPDLVRLTEMMDILVENLLPGTSIPLFSAPGVQSGWIVVAGTVPAEPADKDKVRSLQVITAHFQSGESGKV
ncbi:MAG TPA: hypothetical protein PLD10_15995 [Rhodopila sp.]|nr:hypothetical protein [Rhodopila sp.]